MTWPKWSLLKTDKLNWFPHYSEVGRRWRQRKVKAKYGEAKWKLICEELPDRNHVQCFHRWTQTLKPGVRTGAWTKEEDSQLRKFVKVHGPSNWGQVATSSSVASLTKSRPCWRR